MSSSTELQTEWTTISLILSLANDLAIRNAAHPGRAQGPSPLSVSTGNTHPTMVGVTIIRSDSIMTNTIAVVPQSTIHRRSQIAHLCTIDSRAAHQGFFLMTLESEEFHLPAVTWFHLKSGRPPLNHHLHQSLPLPHLPGLLQDQVNQCLAVHRLSIKACQNYLPSDPMISIKLRAQIGLTILL